MGNTYNYLKSVFPSIIREINQSPILSLLILMLVTIPLGYAVNNIAFALLAVVTLITIRKRRFSLQPALLLPILLYGLMLLSLTWSIDTGSTAKALLKEISLLILPILFMLFRQFSKQEKQFVLKLYSYAIVAFSTFYLIKAIFRYFQSGNSDVFFYHELVTKDVNAIHVSVYVALALFYFISRANKLVVDYLLIVFLFVMIFLLSSKNIMIVVVGLLLIYSLFYWKTTQKYRFKNLIILLLLFVPILFAGKIKQRFLIEYQTVTTENTLNTQDKDITTVYNKSVKEAWTNEQFTRNDFLPGTAFRVFQVRIFSELLSEDPILLTGYGLNASERKVQAKVDAYNLDPGYGTMNFHNQYIQNFAELGIFGLLLLLAMLFINLRNGIKSKDFVHITFAVLMISLFLTESFLWRQRGVMFFTILYCLFNAQTSIPSEKENV